MRPEHLSNRLMVLRRYSLSSMHDKASATKALTSYTRQTNTWTTQYTALCNPINASIGLLSLAHLWVRAEKLGVKFHPALTATAQRLVDLTMARRTEATSHTVCNVYWALGRLKIWPASIVPAYESALAEIFIATQQDCNLVGLSSVLWSMAMLNLNSLNGRLLETAVGVLERTIHDPDLNCVQHMQV